MIKSIRSGLSFGLTSGVITTLGFLIGLGTGTDSKLIVIGGIIMIAVSDSLSDALGVHLMKESAKTEDSKSVWISTVTTFLAKVIFTLTFIVPVIIFPLFVAMIVGLVWGILLLTVISYFVAKDRGEPPVSKILEHVVIALVVVTVTHFIGDFISGHTG